MAQATTTEYTTSASAIVDASPEDIFDFLRQPENHPLISGDSSVQHRRSGPDRIALGDKFSMSMKMGLPYRISSKVVEYEENRKIAWCHLGRHRWRWELEPTADGKTQVTETFDMSTSPLKPALKIAGYPKGHETNVARSVENVAAHFASEA